MNRAIHHRRIQGALFALSWSILAVVTTPLAISQPAPNPFDERRFLATATPTATPDELIRVQPAPAKPLPRSLKISIVLALIAGVLAILALSVRAWRTGNLFDREYRFPVATTIATRLGARRSGGCMATITFEKSHDPRSGGFQPPTK